MNMNTLLGVIGVGRALVQDAEGVRARSYDERGLAPELRGLLDDGLFAEHGGLVGTGTTEGEGVFDFRYGPFTGGYPEAGVFHFHTYGEKILSVQADLSCKRRAIEAFMTGRGVDDCVEASAMVAGNFAAAHSLAFCRAVEAARGLSVPSSAKRIRIIALELERIYNHLMVIARLSLAAAQKVLAAHVEALFEETLRINASFSGSRLLAGVSRIGAVAPKVSDPGAAWLRELPRRVEALRRRFESIYGASLSNRNYLDRLHNIAAVSPELAARCSLTGPSLRAVGVARDLRGSEELLRGFAPVTKEEGDALARMEVRAEEILQSCALIARQCEALQAEAAAPEGHASAATSSDATAGDSPSVPTGGDRAAEGAGVGAAESPSGTVAWWVELAQGRVARARVSTPSLFGFQVFAEALCGHIFTDFPFAFDSFGLSFADAAR